MKKFWHRISKIDIVLIILICIILDILMSVVFEGTPAIFGCRVIQVRSSSMENSNINVDDLWVIKKESKYNIGDIIAFKHDNSIWFHEIIDNQNGIFITKGSSNSIPDSDVVTSQDILGKKTNINLNFLNNYTIRILVIAIPYMIFMCLLSLKLCNLILSWRGL